jgi:S1-C subfamily serine protease
MSRFWRHFVSDGHGGQDCTPLGVHGHGVPIPIPLVRRFALTRRCGVEVWSVRRDGPAHQAGLRRDDILLAVAERPTATVPDLERVLRRLGPGTPVPVLVLRGESLLERLVVPDDSLDATPTP